MKRKGTQLDMNVVKRAATAATTATAMPSKPSTRICVKNIPPSTTRASLVSHLLATCPGAGITSYDHVVKKNIVFVGFDSLEDSRRAVEGLKWFNGRKVRGEYCNDEVRGRQNKKNQNHEKETTRGGGKNEQKRIYVTNLPYTIKSSDVTSVFSTEAVKALSSYLLLDDNGRSRGCCFVSYSTTEDVARAIDAFDGKIVQGRRVSAAAGVDRAEKEAVNGRYKDRMQAERISKAGGESDLLAWNSHYVNHNAAIKAAVDKTGVSKSDILNIGSGGGVDAGVKVALAEVEVMESNKGWFLNHDVSRSRGETEAFMVKNLGPDFKVEMITGLLSPVKPMSMLLSPTRTLLIVRFYNLKDARVGFKRVAYRKISSGVCYAEWVSVGKWEGLKCEGEGDDKGEADEAKCGSSVQVNSAQSQAATAPSASAESASASASASSSRTVHVKNLNVSTSHREFVEFVEERLGQCDISASDIASITLPPQKGDAEKNVGYGFVELKSSSAVGACIAGLDKRELHGRSLAAEVATGKGGERAEREGEEALGDESSWKIIVRNIPFSSTRLQLTTLFSTIGPLKKITIPKKYDGTSRGFAFVSFASREDARRCKEKMAGVHLEGRRIVMEWEKGDNKGA